ncbi:unnamed protein product [Moneuplotes crassus]|uniref:Protein kinase domain-containing protein n=1 Tax=Euplotes crassus TaxID=5936 RepID=A0AAD1X9Q0_EUPCR|nr:unnamed protein product [Moneuplotes crassus]
MSDINHPNIINMLNSTNSELASGGELFDFIAQNASFSKPVARFYFHQMIDAFEYLYLNCISHRDMKPDNIMFNKEFNLKIADFGLSFKAASNQSFKSTRTTWLKIS